MAVDVIRQYVLPHLNRIRPAGGGGFKASCPCPGHGRGRGDRTPSLEIRPGRDQPVVFHCHAGCDQDAVKEALVSAGVDWALCSGQRATVDSDEWMPCGWDSASKTYDQAHRKTAEYLYRDADGAVVFGVARCALKSAGCGFRQWRPDPTTRSGRRWSRSLPDGSKVGEGLPYRLPELLDANARERTVWIVEGEKDADRLWSIGYAATCNAGGAGKWTLDHARYLAGADVIVVADRDDPGWDHAEQVCNTLMAVGVRSLEVRRARTGKDVSDHLDAGLDTMDMVTIAVPVTDPGIEVSS